MVDDVKNPAAEFICVYNSLQKCHQIIPKDYILVVAPFWKLSETIEGVNEMPGKCIITLKTQSQIPVDETLEELVEALSARVIGKRTELVTSAPERPKIELVSNVVDLESKN